MMACTWPAGTIRFTPLRISRSSIRACRLRISSIGVVTSSLRVLGLGLAVPVIDAVAKAIEVANRSVVVRVAGVPAEHTKFAGVRVLADIGKRHGRNAVVAQHRGAGVDDLMGRVLAARRCAKHGAGPDRVALRAEAIGALALEDDEHLVVDMVDVERAT